MGEIVSSDLDLGWSVRFKYSDLISNEDKENFITQLLENEDDLMPIVKKYLVGCLEKVMENPEEIIKDIIKEKDSTIKDLNNKVKDLENKIAILEDLINVLQSPYKDNITSSPWNGIYWSSTSGTYNTCTSISSSSSTV